MNRTAFHPDELDAQARAGAGANGAGIREFMSDQHRAFFPLLSYLFVATADRAGWPIATVLTGQPGFVQAPGATALQINTLPEAEDPVAPHINIGQNIGLLGLDLATRRRNRVNGHVTAIDGCGFTVSVRQSFGNCPQYIQARDVHAMPRQPSPLQILETLDDEAVALIAKSDTFFVATTSRAGLGATGGPDMSHRGGRPGFVRMDDDRLTIPDYRGNRYYNTLGNMLGEPRASLLFIDFEEGHLLHLQGIATVDWSNAGARIEGAERSWQFKTARIWRRRNACPLRWSFKDYAPTTIATGLWRS